MTTDSAASASDTGRATAGSGGAAVTYAGLPVSQPQIVGMVAPSDRDSGNGDENRAPESRSKSSSKKEKVAGSISVASAAGTDSANGSSLGHVSSRCLAAIKSELAFPNDQNADAVAAKIVSEEASTDAPLAPPQSRFLVGSASGSTSAAAAATAAANAAAAAAAASAAADAAAATVASRADAESAATSFADTPRSDTRSNTSGNTNGAADDGSSVSSRPGTTPSQSGHSAGAATAGSAGSGSVTTVASTRSLRPLLASATARPRVRTFDTAFELTSSTHGDGSGADLPTRVAIDFDAEAEAADAAVVAGSAAVSVRDDGDCDDVAVLCAPLPLSAALQGLATLPGNHAAAARAGLYLPSATSVPASCGLLAPAASHGHAHRALALSTTAITAPLLPRAAAAAASQDWLSRITKATLADSPHTSLYSEFSQIVALTRLVSGYTPPLPFGCLPSRPATLPGSGDRDAFAISNINRPLFAPLPPAGLAGAYALLALSHAPTPAPLSAPVVTGRVAVPALPPVATGAMFAAAGRAAAARAGGTSAATAAAAVVAAAAAASKVLRPIRGGVSLPLSVVTRMRRAAALAALSTSPHGNRGSASEQDGHAVGGDTFAAAFIAALSVAAVASTNNTDGTRPVKKESDASSSSAGDVNMTDENIRLLPLLPTNYASNSFAIANANAHNSSGNASLTAAATAAVAAAVGSDDATAMRLWMHALTAMASQNSSAGTYSARLGYTASTSSASLSATGVEPTRVLMGSLQSSLVIHSLLTVLAQTTSVHRSTQSSSHSISLSQRLRAALAAAMTVGRAFAALGLDHPVAAFALSVASPPALATSTLLPAPSGSFSALLRALSLAHTGTAAACPCGGSACEACAQREVDVFTVRPSYAAAAVAARALPLVWHRGGLLTGCVSYTTPQSSFVSRGGSCGAVMSAIVAVAKAEAEAGSLLAAKHATARARLRQTAVDAAAAGASAGAGYSDAPTAPIAGGNDEAMNDADAGARKSKSGSAGKSKREPLVGPRVMPHDYTTTFSPQPRAGCSVADVGQAFHSPLCPLPHALSAPAVAIVFLSLPGALALTVAGTPLVAAPAETVVAGGRAGVLAPVTALVAEAARADKADTDNYDVLSAPAATAAAARARGMAHGTKTEAGTNANRLRRARSKSPTSVVAANGGNSYADAKSAHRRPPQPHSQLVVGDRERHWATGLAAQAAPMLLAATNNIEASKAAAVRHAAAAAAAAQQQQQYLLLQQQQQAAAAAAAAQPASGGRMGRGERVKAEASADFEAGDAVHGAGRMTRSTRARTAGGQQHP